MLMLSAELRGLDAQAKDVELPNPGVQANTTLMENVELRNLGVHESATLVRGMEPRSPGVQASAMPVRNVELLSPGVQTNMPRKNVEQAGGGMLLDVMVPMQDQVK